MKQIFNVGISFVILFPVLGLLLSSGTAARVKRGSGGRGISLTPTVILDIIDKHNELRASVSSSNMRRLSWDSELAMISQEYGKKCQFSHNTERSHSYFKTSVGENIYVSSGALERFDSKNAIQLWFDENVDFDYSTRTCRRDKICGHYTQIVWSDTYKIGCSLSMCADITGFSQSPSHLFICNYSPAGNVYTAQSDGSRSMLSPFLQGQPCSQCKNTSDTCSRRLCSNSYRARSITQIPLEEYANDNTGLVVAVVLLSLALTALLIYTIFRKQITLAYNNWKSQRNPDYHARFSNQNTPQPSGTNTPRTSIVATHLHGLPRSQNNDRKSSSTPPSLLITTTKPARHTGQEVRNFLEVTSHQPTNPPNKPLRPPPMQGRPR